MPSSKEIRTQIDSIKKTQQITRAMELVSASKVRKVQARMATSRPYAEKALQVVHHLANCHTEYHHPYLRVRDVKRVGFIIISTDRGLCGGLNNNMFKATLTKIQEMQKKDVAVDLCLVGSKAAGFFKRVGGNIVAHASHLGDTPSVSDLVGIVKVMLDSYDNGELDELHVCYNVFVNTMKQEPTVQQLLPLENVENESSKYYWDYIYEPDAKDLLDVLLKRYIESQVFQSVVENIASEHAARMVAMKSATDNAGELIDGLRLVYNKARQAVITREIAEIVSGADAV